MWNLDASQVRPCFWRSHASRPVRARSKPRAFVGVTPVQRSRPPRRLASARCGRAWGCARVVGLNVEWPSADRELLLFDGEGGCPAFLASTVQVGQVDAELGVPLQRSLPPRRRLSNGSHHSALMRRVGRPRLDRGGWRARPDRDRPVPRAQRLRQRRPTTNTTGEWHRSPCTVRRPTPPRRL